MDTSDTTPSQMPTPSPGATESRPSRAAASRRSRRPLVIALSILGVLVLAGLAAGAWAAWTWSNTRPPQKLVVIGESTLEDGTTVAGLVAVIESVDGKLSVEPVDSGEEVTIPGTSYSRLRDALTMGGPDEVVSILAAGADTDATAWIVLDEQAWARLIDRAGGVEFQIPEEITVFTGEELFRFSKGTEKLSGAEAVALVMGADELESAGGGVVRLKASEAVARAIADNPDLGRELLSAPGVELSTDASLIGTLLGYAP